MNWKHVWDRLLHRTPICVSLAILSIFNITISECWRVCVLGRSTSCFYVQAHIQRTVLPVYFDSINHRNVYLINIYRFESDKAKRLDTVANQGTQGFNKQLLKECRSNFIVCFLMASRTLRGTAYSPNFTDFMWIAHTHIYVIRRW